MYELYTASNQAEKELRKALKLGMMSRISLTNSNETRARQAAHIRFTADSKANGPAGSEAILE